jgi:transcriptional regulator with XRE-family HTH domain
MNLGALITSICKRAQSTNKAAKLSGVSQGTLSEWQSGKVSPGLEKYIELCLALGCRPGFELDQYLGFGQGKTQNSRRCFGRSVGTTTHRTATLNLFNNCQVC